MTVGIKLARRHFIEGVSTRVPCSRSLKINSNGQWCLSDKGKREFSLMITSRGIMNPEPKHQRAPEPTTTENGFLDHQHPETWPHG